MANILDYIDWRGDLSFEAAPFTETDALVLAEFGYVPLEGTVLPGFGGTVSFREAYDRFSPENVSEKLRIISFEQDCVLFGKMAASRRYGGAKLMGYTNIIDCTKEIQFSAVTILLDNGTAFVSFRGTDGSLVGWKEDFSLSYSNRTAGQLYAESYLNSALAGNRRPVRVGGHSKGGNLAIYASAFARPEIASQITDIYAFDAPGFRDEVTGSPEYSAIMPKIHSFVPETSVVGMLLNTGIEYKVVQNSGSGFMQHLAYNWETGPLELPAADGLSRSGEVINKAISGFLEEFSDEDRRAFTDAVFGVLSAPEKDTFREILKGKLASTGAMIKAYRGFTQEQRTVIKEAIIKLAKKGGTALLPKNDK